MSHMFCHMSNSSLCIQQLMSEALTQPDSWFVFTPPNFTFISFYIHVFLFFTWHRDEGVVSHCSLFLSAIINLIHISHTLNSNYLQYQQILTEMTPTHLPWSYWDKTKAIFMLQTSGLLCHTCSSLSTFVCVIQEVRRNWLKTFRGNLMASFISREEGNMNLCDYQTVVILIT